MSSEKKQQKILSKNRLINQINLLGKIIMGSTIQINQRNQFNRTDLRDLHVLRAKVFKDRMGWEVPVLDGMEIDGYDALEPHYM